LTHRDVAVRQGVTCTHGNWGRLPSSTDLPVTSRSPQSACPSRHGRAVKPTTCTHEQRPSRAEGYATDGRHAPPPPRAPRYTETALEARQTGRQVATWARCYPPHDGLRHGRATNGKDICMLKHPSVFTTRPGATGSRCTPRTRYRAGDNRHNRPTGLTPPGHYPAPGRRADRRQSG
jgi:hypothetical protein